MIESRTGRLDPATVHLLADAQAEPRTYGATRAAVALARALLWAGYELTASRWAGVAFQRAARRRDRDCMATALLLLLELRQKHDPLSGAETISNALAPIILEIGTSALQGEHVIGRAFLYSQAREFNEAWTVLRRARQAFAAKGDRAGEIAVILFKSELEHGKRTRSRPQFFMEHVRALSRSLRDPAMEAKALARIALVKLFRGDLSSAQKDLQAALTLTRDQGNRFEGGVALFYWGHLQKALGNPTGALTSYHASNELRGQGRRSSPPATNHEAKCLLSRALINVHFGHLAIAKPELEAALHIQKKLNDHENIAFCLGSLGEIHALLAAR